MIPVRLRPMAYCLNATLAELGVGWWAVVVVFAVPLVPLLAAVVPVRRLPRPRLVGGLAVAAVAQAGGTVLLVCGPGNYPQAWRVWWWFFGWAAVCWFLAMCLTAGPVADAAARRWGRRRPAVPYDSQATN